MHYYARWKFIDGLLHSVQMAKDAGEKARVMTAMAVGGGGNIDLNDLGLKKNYSLGTAPNVSATYNDLAVEVRFSFAYPFLGHVLNLIITGPRASASINPLPP